MAADLKDGARRAGITLSAHLRALFADQTLYASRIRELEAQLKAAKAQTYNASRSKAEEEALYETALANGALKEAAKRIKALEAQVDELKAATPGDALTLAEALKENDRLTRAYKGLVTANRTLRRKVRYYEEDVNARVPSGAMPSAVRLTIIKSLHADKGESTPEVRDEALKRFNA
jgi:DNA repair exonuclease SbcCD ATPase subunit